MSIEIVPAILRRTYERIAEDWDKVHTLASHIHIDVTDGVFAGDGTFRDVRHFKRLPDSQKIELHMMVHNPDHYIDDVADLNPARCLFHIEAFADGGHIDETYTQLRSNSSSELGLAINPDTPWQWLEEQLPRIDFVLFMGVKPGYGGAPLEEKVFRNMGAFHKQHPDVPITVDGSVNLTTVPKFVAAGATILCANSAIFEGEPPQVNIARLQDAAVS
ncbi:hypothetical protein CL628_00235 [bacterium]|nr:hypothetical protein [bacterium]